MFRLGARALLIAISLFAAPAVLSPTGEAAQAQDADATKAKPTGGDTAPTDNTGSKKKSKSGPRYEEYYELVPADEGDPSGGAAAVNGSGLDPEGDVSPPPPGPAPASAPRRTHGTHKSMAPAPAHRAEPQEQYAPGPGEPAEVDNTPADPAPSPAASEQASKIAGKEAATPVASEGGFGDDISDLSYFHDVLDKGGSWRAHARYGEVFVPDVPADWRPYTLGHWVYSDAYGWTWISDEPFGWATYHFGRWMREGTQGWMWIPGGEWGPSWVVWRQTNDAIGWAALPPSATFSQGRLSLDANAIDNDGFEESWVFVRPRYFARTQMNRYLRPARWNPDLVDRSQAHLGYERDAETGHILNRGIPPDEVEKLAGAPVPRTTVTPVDDPRAMESATAHVLSIRKGEVKIFRPTRKRVEQVLKGTTRSKRRSNNSSASPRARAADAAPSNAPKTIAPRPAARSPSPETEQSAPSAGEPGSQSEAVTTKSTAPPAADQTRATGPKSAGGETASLPAGKRHWDASGPSGAPAPPAASPPDDQ